MSISNGWPLSWPSFTRSIAILRDAAGSFSAGIEMSSRGSSWSTGTL